MQLSKETIEKASQIYKILESIQSPDDLLRLLQRKRKRPPTCLRTERQTGPIPKAAPSYDPTELRSEADNTYLLAMCYHVEGLFGNNAILERENRIKLIIDSGATITISPHKEDFVNGIQNVQSVTLKGIAGGCEVEGIGSVVYRIPRPNKKDFELRIEQALYVPSCPSRLLCPQQLHRESTLKGPHNASFQTHAAGAILIHEGERFEFAFHPRTKLPVLDALCHQSVSRTTTIGASESGTEQAMQALAGDPNEDHISIMDPNDLLPTAEAQPQPLLTQRVAPAEDNQTCSHEEHEPGLNLTHSQKELLEWHYKLGHQDMQAIQKMVLRKALPGAPARLARVKDIPKCVACLQGKARKRTHQDHQGVIGHAHDKPGLGVSVDHVEAGQPGYLWQTKGVPTNRRYKYFSLYVDHSSRFLYHFFQEGKSAAETLKGKHAFEAFARSKGVQIHHIHTDNGVFNSDLYKSDVENQHQTISFCGVNAHWQNGIVERYNGVVCASARTMILHGKRFWPSQITSELWPFAVQHAVNLHNITVPRQGEFSPWEKFTRTDSPWQLSQMKTLFCPVYVLDRRLQEGNRLSKWQQRAVLGVYVGHCHQYSGTVPLVWNPATKLVSPQFHVVFDENFETVSAQPTAESEADLQAIFDKLFSSSRWSYDDLFPVEQRYFFDQLWERHNNNTDNRPIVGHRRATVGRKRLGNMPASEGVTRKRVAIGIQTDPPADMPDPKQPSDSRKESPIGNTSTTQVRTPASPECISLQADSDSEQTLDDEVIITSPPTKRSRLESSNNPNTLSHDDRHQIAIISQYASLSDPIYALNTKLYSKINGIESTVTSIPRGSRSVATQTNDPDQALDEAVAFFFSQADEEKEIDLHAYSAAVMYGHSVNDGIDHDVAYLNDLEPYVFSAIGISNDVLTQSEMLRAPDKDKFIEVQENEIRGLEQKDVFEYVRKSEVPRNKKLLNAVWSYRRKRRPDGTLWKYKARLCADGSQQVQGLDYNESYAPVVQWSTVRLVMILASMLNLESRQIDFEQAFTQADLDDDVYMKLPQGWQVDDTDDWCIKLKKNLYGLVC